MSGTRGTEVVGGNRPSSRALATGSVAVLLALGGLARAQQVTLTELPLLPGGHYASAYGINDDGKIVGVADDANGQYQTVEWVDGVIAVMPTLVLSGLCVPEDVNDRGETTGTTQIFGGSLTYGNYWDAQNDPFVMDGLPGGDPFRVKGHSINSLGQIAGRALEGGANVYAHACVWLGTSLQTDLGFMGGGTYSEAYGINDRGEVVGVATVANTNQHAFLWKNGSFTDLSTWSGGAVSSYARAINDHGQIVGLNNSVASIWENGSVTALPMPPGISAYTPAIDINDSGEIIATGSKGYPDEVGVLWRDGVPIDLGTLPGGNISRARRLNAHGAVVGEAKAADGFFRAVLWTIDPPRTWTDLGHALPGSNGVPALTGSGDLSPSSHVSVEVNDGRPNSRAILVIGSQTLYAPLWGGTLVPYPDFLMPSIKLDAQGHTTLSTTLPPDLPSGTDILLHCWILDPTGPRGFSATNALKGTTP